MKKFLSFVFIFIIFLSINACIDPCDFEEQVYLGNSIDVVDNSGLKPMSLNGEVVKAKAFGIYVQLDYRSPINPDACLITSNETPTRFEIITINRFNANYIAGSVISTAFTILNTEKSYPVNILNAKIKQHNYLLLNYIPFKDTIQQFIVKSYKDTILTAIDTSRPILIKR